MGNQCVDEELRNCTATLWVTVKESGRPDRRKKPVSFVMTTWPVQGKEPEKGAGRAWNPV